MKCIIAALFILVLAPEASAVSVAKFKEVYPQNKAYFTAYMSGVGEGMGFASIRGELKGNPRLFCPPTDVSFSGDDYIALALRQFERLKAQRGADPEAIHMEVALMMALETEHPCGS